MKVSFCFKEKLLATNENYFLCYYKGFLVVKNNGFTNIKKIRIHRWWESFRLVERLLRKEPRLAVSIDDNVFLYSNNGGLYTIDVVSCEVKCIFKYIRGMNNPLYFCTKKNDNGKVNEVLFGEYIWNEDNGPVSIYRYDLKKVEPIYTFEAGKIKHIHNIVFDVYNDRYLIMTGDDDSESSIWEANSDFSIIKKIVGGKQMYRSCVCLPTKEAIYYATDTPLEENHIYKIENGKVLEGSSINGPCIYGVIKDECLYLATSVEGDPTVGMFRYRFFNKLGKGVKSRFVHILKLNFNGQLEKIVELKKDWLPMWLFQFGNAQFIESKDCVFFSTQSTTKKGTYKITEEIENEEQSENN